MTTHRYLPWLFVLFVGSGCAALIYEIVWFQLLQMVIGSSAVSLGVLLGTFMGGMCLGSFLLPRLVSARQHPLRVYAFLELGVAISGILVLLLIPIVADAYTAFGGRGIGGVFLRAVLCAICLLPPTLMMGATLPAISRWVQATPNGVSWLGYFYGGNTAGAVFGCLLAGFYLLPFHDMPTATYVAVLINVAVAAMGVGLASEASYQSSAPGADTPALALLPGAKAVYVTIALSGLTALGAEVIWTRELALLLGGSTYTFSIILAVFLAGIGGGSSVGSYAAHRLTRPRLALGLCQLLLVVWMAWSAYAIARSLPYWPVIPGLTSSPWFLFQLDLVRCVYAIFPAACLWGASFPLALAAVASDRHDAGRVVGAVYAANTVGAIAGALLFSIVLIPVLGTQDAQRVLILIAACAAGLMLFPFARSARARAALGFATAVTGALVWSIAPIPFELIAYGRQAAGALNSATELYRGEGINSTIAVSESLKDPGVRFFHVSGKIEASNTPQDMRLQLLLGNLPALLHPKPASVLVVGFGAGVTAGSFVPYPDLKRLVICEMEPLVPQATSKYFAQENQNVAKDPRTEIVFDDGRHFVRTTHETFDIITSDPINPWVKGAATLYTREYFEQVKARLNPGGVVTQWVPLYESSEAAVKSEIATFFEVFPNGTVWGNRKNGQGYDVVLLGTVEPARVDIDAIDARLARVDHAGVAAALKAVGFGSSLELLATYGGNAHDLKPWLADAQINRDRNLRLQYLAGMASNVYAAGPIYERILAFRGQSDALFVGSEARKQALQTALRDAR